MVKMSFLAEKLRRQTSELADLLTRRINDLKDKDGLASLIKNLSKSRTKTSFFEPGDYYAVGIDGSMDYDEVLEMLLFYVCATGFRCKFTVNDEIKFYLDEVFRDRRLMASTSVPLWIEDLYYVTEESDSTEYDLTRTAERIPYSLMTMAELYLALKAADEDDVKLILLDRPIHGTYGPVSRDLRLLLKRKKSVLFEMNTSHGPTSYLDFSLAFILGSGKGYIPPRGRYLPFAAVHRLLKVGECSFKELIEDLGISERAGRSMLKNLLKMHRDSGGRLFAEDFNPEDENPTLKIDGQVKNYWVRVKETSLLIVNRIFGSYEHPLMLSDDSWLTVFDLNAVNVMLIQMLREKVIDGKLLVVGIAKDTSASDYVRAVIPYARHDGLIPKDEKPPNLRHDRAFLTILSSVNSHLFDAPWRTISYDACFTTLVEGGDETPLRAARQRIVMERQFVKAYFQLREFKSDLGVRSPTFLYDRFYIPNVDDKFHAEIMAVEGRKKIKISPYWEGEGENPLDTFILRLLSRCDNPEVMEAMGHNQLLYLADKAVKNEVKMMRGLLRGVADLELGGLSRRQKIFTIARRFRDIRREVEGARERAVMEEK